MPANLAFCLMCADLDRSAMFYRAAGLEFTERPRSHHRRELVESPTGAFVLSSTGAGGPLVTTGAVVTIYAEDPEKPARNLIELNAPRISQAGFSFLDPDDNLVHIVSPR